MITWREYQKKIKKEEKDLIGKIARILFDKSFWFCTVWGLREASLIKTLELFFIIYELIQ